MDEFLQYLPSLITTLLVVPFGIYLQTRFKNLATKNDFDDAVSQLERSTKAVESIKSQMNEKYWVKQQVWETKRAAYEELTTSLYLTDKYLDKLVMYLSEHNDCFVYIGHSYDGPYETAEEEAHMRSYQEYIEAEQTAFMEKYESEQSKEERQKLLQKTKESIFNLANIFSIKSIYLHADIDKIEDEISVLKREIFDKELSQENDESSSDYFERVLEHYMKCKESLTGVISTTKTLAVRDLKLDD